MEGKTSNGRKLTVVVTPDGKTLAVNTVATPDEVPQEATAALRHWVSGFQPASVVRSVRDGGARVWYDLVGRGAGASR